MENVQVLLIATGENKKLTPISLETPSPMLPLVDRPTMLYAVEQAARQGFKNLLVSLYYLSGHIEAYFGKGERWGVTIDYLLQRDAWGNAGAMKWAQPSITKTCVVMPADTIVDIDINHAVRTHKKNGNMLTVVSHRVGTEGKATVSVDVSSHEETAKNDVENWYNTGVYIFEPEVLNHIPERTPFDIETQLLPTLAAAGLKIGGVESRGYWNTLESFQDYHEAQRHVLGSASGDKEALNGLPALTFPMVEGREISPGIWVGRNHMIHPTARLSPPVYVGTNCQIGSDVELGPDVVIGSNVVIDDEATICHSTILDHTYVGQLVNIDRRVVDKKMVVDLITGESTEVVDYFLLDEAQPAILDSRLLRIWDIVSAVFLGILSLVISVPVALLVFFTSGRLFQRDSRRGGWASLLYAGSDEPLPVFSLLRFYTRKDNGRYTLIGRWLEQWEGHRLPELWNVLKGDIHLVGVKPLTTEQIAQITEAWQEKRNEYQPGFTGIWYLQTKPTSSLDEILIADAYYVATRSWREDLRILRKTPIAWWHRIKNSQN